MVVPNPPPEIWSLAWWDQFVPLVQAGVVLVTGYVAVRGLHSWRVQMVGKRKAELAEQVLTGFYEARDALARARRAGFLEGDGKSRPSIDGEPEQVRLMRDTYYIPIERLNCDIKVFASLKAQSYLVKAYFGEAALRPFVVLSDAHSSIIHTASILIKMAIYDGAQGGVTPAREKLLDDLGWGRRDRPDDMDKGLDRAVADMEAICRPVLEGRG